MKGFLQFLRGWEALITPYWKISNWSPLGLSKWIDTSFNAICLFNMIQIPTCKVAWFATYYMLSKNNILRFYLYSGAKHISLFSQRAFDFHCSIGAHLLRPDKHNNIHKTFKDISAIWIKNFQTSQRYRLQSDNLPSLWIILQTLEKRLHKRFSRNKQVQARSEFRTPKYWEHLKTGLVSFSEFKFQNSNITF